MSCLATPSFYSIEQLDDPRNYVAVLKPSPLGFTSLIRYRHDGRIERSNIKKYPAVLRELGYVERVDASHCAPPGAEPFQGLGITDPISVSTIGLPWPHTRRRLSRGGF
ncbi:MAG: hypothetical protein IPJ94_29630 [Chloroflexi bacterium]|nr:hypothetical protein [Chloroflexota bacterium]